MLWKDAVKSGSSNCSFCCQYGCYVVVFRCECLCLDKHIYLIQATILKRLLQRLKEFLLLSNIDNGFK